jgi:hypothetical protein
VYSELGTVSTAVMDMRPVPSPVSGSKTGVLSTLLAARRPKHAEGSPELYVVVSDERVKRASGGLQAEPLPAPLPVSQRTAAKSRWSHKLVHYLGCRRHARPKHQPEEFEESCGVCGLIDPEGFFKTRWDIFMVFATLYSLFVTPYVLSFGDISEMQPLDYIMDFSFLSDVYISSRTTYDAGLNEMETSSLKVFKRYVKGWFFLDLAASIPAELIIALSTVTQSDAVPPRAIKLLRLMRFARLLRFARLFQLGQRFRFTNAMRIVKLGA